MHDTHAHLDLLLEKLEIINLKDASSKNQFENLINEHSWIIHPTVSKTNFEDAYSLFEEFNKVFFLLGSHPEIVDEKFDVQNYIQSIEDLKSKLKQFKRLVGIGECGLDYFYSQNSSILEKQQVLFEYNINLAVNLNLPLVIHARNAWENIWKTLEAHPKIHGKFLIHCFTGNKNELYKCLDLGGKASFGGITTFPKSVELQEAAKLCPNNSFTLETDLPFLAPNPNRGKICLPKMIQNTAQFLAEIKNIAVEDVWRYSLENSEELFNLK